MSGPIIIDEVDERIIALLREDGRASVRAIGRQLGFSESAVRKRIKRLTDGKAISYGTVFDAHAISQAAFGWLLLATTAARAADIAAHVGALANCGFCAVTTGEYNIRAYLSARDLQAMAGIVEDIGRLDGVRATRFRQGAVHSRHRYEYVVLSGD